MNDSEIIAELKREPAAELDRYGELVQFYADERGANMKPGKDAEDAINKWIRTFKPRIRKQIKAAA